MIDFRYRPGEIEMLLFLCLVSLTRMFSHFGETGKFLMDGPALSVGLSGGFCFLSMTALLILKLCSRFGGVFADLVL